MSSISSRLCLRRLRTTSIVTGSMVVSAAVKGRLGQGHDVLSLSGSAAVGTSNLNHQLAQLVYGQHILRPDHRGRAVLLDDKWTVDYSADIQRAAVDDACLDVARALEGRRVGALQWRPRPAVRYRGRARLGLGRAT